MMDKCTSRVKRGRPPSSSIREKILEGLSSNSQIKCEVCNREFPRNKSLQAHMRTHTGEKPYACDYPECDAAFAQSGHLRSHAYRHSGEKCYTCPIEGCPERFIHSNRHCSEHKELKLVRDGKEVIRTDLENLSEKEILWILRYKEKKSKKGSSSPKERTGRKRSFSEIQSSEESSDQDSLKNSLSVEPMANCETSGYSSLSSEHSSSPSHYELKESVDEDPERRDAANTLIQLRNSIWNIDYLARLLFARNDQTGS